MLPKLRLVGDVFGFLSVGSDREHLLAEGFGFGEIRGVRLEDFQKLQGGVVIEWVELEGAAEREGGLVMLLFFRKDESEQVGGAGVIRIFFFKLFEQREGNLDDAWIIEQSLATEAMAFPRAEADGHEFEGFLEMHDRFIEAPVSREGHGEAGLQAVGVFELAESFFVAFGGFPDQPGVEKVIRGLSLADGIDQERKNTAFSACPESSWIRARIS